MKCGWRLAGAVASRPGGWKLPGLWQLLPPFQVTWLPPEVTLRDLGRPGAGGFLPILCLCRRWLRKCCLGHLCSVPHPQQSRLPPPAPPAPPQLPLTAPPTLPPPEGQQLS